MKNNPDIYAWILSFCKSAKYFPSNSKSDNFISKKGMPVWFEFFA